MRRVLSAIRLDEVLILQGSPVLGAIFSMGKPSLEKAGALALLVAGSVCLVAHVFALNDWSGIGGDLNDPNRATAVFTEKRVGRSEVGYLSLFLLAASLSLLSPFGRTTVVIGLAIAAASALYSIPAFHLKGMPILNIILHVTGGLLHFLLGYTLFSQVDARGLAIGFFFALTFAAGHLTHEARDYDADSRNGIKTNAVAFGQARVFVAGLGLFTSAYGLLFFLAMQAIVPRILMLVAALYPLHLFWSLRVLAGQLNFASIRRLQVRYRALYGAIGLLMALAVLLT